MKLLKPLVLASLCFAGIAYAQNFNDNFQDANHETRKALRGDWKFENNEASCVSDPELYKKFKNHGPILRWPANFKDGTIEFEFRPKGCQRVVFTLNNKTGHVFRMANADGSTKSAISKIFGWAGPSKEKEKFPAQMIAKEGVPTIAEIEGKWVPVKLVIKGDQADVTVGDYTEKLQHACLARDKSEVTLSFASGELAMRNVKLTVAE